MDSDDECDYCYAGNPCVSDTEPWCQDCEAKYPRCHWCNDLAAGNSGQCIECGHHMCDVDGCGRYDSVGYFMFYNGTGGGVCGDCIRAKFGTRPQRRFEEKSNEE